MPLLRHLTGGVKFMKDFTIIKIGYTAGIYGCSNEYFTVIIHDADGENHYSFTFYGMYGAEERVARVLREKGYKEFYTVSIYGRMTRKDIPSKCVQSEYTLIDTLSKL